MKTEVPIRACTLGLLVSMVFMAAACRDGSLFDGAILLNDTGNLTPIDDCPGPPSGAPIRINEVMLINENILQDEDGEFPPAWIELVNTGDDAVEVGGATLTIGSEQWEIPCLAETLLGAGEYLVLFLDGDDEEANPDDLHAPIIPPITGLVTVVFTTDVVNLDASEFGPDQSAGRFPDGAAGFELLLVPTPGTSNSEPLIPPEDVFVRGDVNEDDLVELIDADLIVEILFNDEPYPSCVDRLDANDDGFVDVTDASFLYMALSAGGPPIPAPFPNPDIDFTSDDLPCFVDFGGTQ